MEWLKGKRIAVPGRLTTALLLLKLYDQEGTLGLQVIPMPFSQIMAAVSNGEVDAGLVIHEGRFTFKNYDLTQILDLGQWWESATGQLIPLGGIVARRALGPKTISIIESLIAESIQYSQANPAESLDYIKRHSQELDDSVIRQHITLYVNEYSIDLGSKGRDGLVELLTRAETAGIIPRSSETIFLE
jgi:1,4-dihydroxy-6-naphthoate synthase